MKTFKISFILNYIDDFNEIENYEYVDAESELLARRYLEKRFNENEKIRYFIIYSTVEVV